MNFIAPSEHQILVFLVQVAVMLALARVLGQGCRRIGQPAVVGELAAGVLLGPSILGRGAPDVFEWLFPSDAVQSGMLFTVGWLGVMMLLVVTGFETDLALISRLGRAAVLVTLGSLSLPFVLGIGAGFLAPDALLGLGSERLTFALFLAAALTISSLPVIAKILTDLDLLRRNFGQLTLAVGMANDVIGWVLLGLIAGLASSGTFDAGQLLITIGALTIFLIATVLVGQRFVDLVLRSLRRLSVGTGGFVTVAVAFALTLGSVTQAIGVEGVLGAFIAGILLSRSRYKRHEAEEQLETFTSAFLAPIFFATAGLRVELGTLADPVVVWWAVIIVLVASVAKFVGSWAGARMAGLGDRDGMALGSALNARGALEIVIATVGLSLGVLNDASYTIIVIMAIATSVMAAPLLRTITRNWEGSPDEVIRLKRERRMATNVLVRPTRALVIADDRLEGAFAAELAHAVLPDESPMTIVRTRDNQDTVLDVMRVLQDRALELRAMNGSGVEELLRQAGMGYGLIVAGTSASEPDALSAEETELLRSPDLPVLLARPAPGQRGRPKRILLPLSSTVPARAATEVAVALASKLGAELDLLYVRSDSNDTPDAGNRSRLSAYWGASDPVAQRMFASVSDVARESGIWSRRVITDNASRAAGIIDMAQRRDSDLVIVGVEVQDIGGAVHFGQTATALLAEPDIGLLVVALGPR